ncbi:MAG: hypothetical protein MUC94_07915 [bacterium]|nr:hypothetical protein [bacterium]
MHKIIFLTLISILTFLLPPLELIAQKTEFTQSEPRVQEMRLPIPVLKSDSSNYFSLADEVAPILTHVIRDLGRYDVIVGIQIDSAFYRNEEMIQHFIAMKK